MPAALAPHIILHNYSYATRKVLELCILCSLQVTRHLAQKSHGEIAIDVIPERRLKLSYVGHRRSGPSRTPLAAFAAKVRSHSQAGSACVLRCQMSE